LKIAKNGESPIDMIFEVFRKLMNSD
jgi:hypothetical protein